MSQSSTRTQPLYHFERWTLDAARRQLVEGDRPIELQDQTLDLLLYLVRNPGRVISKDELLDGAWGHGYLTDSAISQAVRRARQALGDSGRHQTFIRTVHGRGFEFLPTVRIEERQPDPASGESRRPWSRFAPLLVGIAVVLALVAFSFQWRPGAGPAAEPTETIAWRLLIEPIEGLDDLDGEWQWLVEGLPATLDDLLRGHPTMETLRLAEVPELAALEPDQRAQVAGANLYLATRLFRTDGRFTIDWQLRQPGQDSSLRDGELSGPDPGLLVRQLVDQIRDPTTRADFPVRVAHMALLDDPLAVELYARAMQAIASEQREEAAKLLEAAMTRQPDSDLLQVALAKARFDPASQDGEALEVYQRLLDDIPDAEPVARAWLAHELGTELWFYGNTVAAEVFLDEALELIDPLDEPLLRGRILNSLAFVFQSRNKYSLAWETALEAEQLLRQRGSPYFLSMALTNLGYLAEDFGRLLQAREFHQEALVLRNQIGVDELIAASEYGLARIERRMGLLESAAERLIANLNRPGIDNRPFDRFDNLEELAEVRMRQGKFEQAAELLEQADTIARESDDQIGLAWSDEVRARLALTSGKVSEGSLEQMERVIERFGELGEEQEGFTARLTHIQMQQALGHSRASGLALDALGDHAALANPVHRIRYQMILARQAELTQREEQCEQLLADALERARQLGSVDQESLAALELADLALARGEFEAAQRFARIAERGAPEHFQTRQLTARLGWDRE